MNSAILKGAMATVTSAKKVLRKEIKNVISGISSEEKERQSREIFRKLIALPQYRESKKVSIYLSTRDEVDTLPILKHMFESSNREIFVPTYKDKHMHMVKLVSMEDYEKLPLTKWNIKQPDFTDDRTNALDTGLDLIILPGVAFTYDGKRCGHGMGYYDKFLTSYLEKRREKPHLIAIAFNEQVRDEIPTNENDVTLDLVLTEKSKV